MTKYNRIELKNLDTGEIYNTQLIEANDVVVGNKIITEAEERKNKGYKNKVKAIEEMSEFIQANEGAYYHLIYKYGYPIMDRLQAKYEGNKANIHIIRLIQLANHVTFGGKLFDENRNEIKKSSLSKIWDTKSRNSINETYNILMECGYIYESEEGYIMISEDLIVKGAIEDFKKLHKADDSLTYTRVFSNNVKDMYEGTKPTQRKQLANLFKVLPFINFKHNVFCSNPMEKDFDKLELLTWTDLARICGYEDDKQVARFKKDLWNLKIYGADTIGQFSCTSGYYICVNPKVYYSGDNVEDVEFLYKSFKMASNCKRGKLVIKKII